MKIKVLVFGVLKNWFGSAESSVELPENATVTTLLEKLGEGRETLPLRGFAVSVNAEFASVSTVLHEGDEVGLLPPVSGGCAEKAIPDVRVELVRAPIEADRLVTEVKDASDGAVVVFDGIVRNQTKGRATLYLDYEGYEEMAIKQLNLLAQQALEKFPVRHVTIVHRLGKMEITESSVLIVVASAHRGAAFDACRWIIDTLKTTVPIWKKEFFADGAEWRDGEPFPAEIAVTPEKLAKGK